MLKEAIFKIAEQKILAAIENGELDNLPGQGKPLKLDEDAHIPEELRTSYKILKNAGVLPEELELKHQIATLEQLIAKCTQDEEKHDLKTKLMDKQLVFNMLMEKRRRR